MVMAHSCSNSRGHTEAWESLTQLQGPHRSMLLGFTGEDTSSVHIDPLAPSLSEALTLHAHCSRAKHSQELHPSTTVKEGHCSVGQKYVNVNVNAECQPMKWCTVMCGCPAIHLVLDAHQIAV